MRSRSFSIQSSIAMLCFVCCGFSSLNAQEKAAVVNNQAKADTTKITRIASATAASGATATPFHTEFAAQGREGTVSSIGAFEDRNVYYFKDRRDAKSDIFFSDAPMYVEKNKDEAGQDKVSMLVLGTMFFADNATITQVGETSLTGDFVSVKEAGTDTEKLFVETLDNNDVHTGTINFIGKWNKQVIKREVYGQKNHELVNAAYNVPADKLKAAPNMLLNFPKIKVNKEGIKTLADIQTITQKPALDELTVSSLDELPFYDFANMGYVAAAPNVSMSVKELDITGGNRFSAEMITEGLYQNSQAKGGISATDTDADKADAAKFYQLNSAYVDIDKLIDGDGLDGYSEVGMRLYNYSLRSDLSPIDDVYGALEGSKKEEDTEVQRTNSYMVQVDIPGKVSARQRATFFRGMTSPFEKLRADYMLYHLLTKPGESNVTGDIGQPIGPPDTEIERGRGYLFAMEASRAKFEEIRGNWHNPGSEGAVDVHPEPQQLREKGGYFFSRVLREIKYDTDYYSAKLPWRAGAKYDNFNFYTTLQGGTKDFEAQRFNTGDVTVELKSLSNGLQFLANPYMTPITLKSILGKKDPTATTTGGIDITPQSTPFPVGRTGFYAVHEKPVTASGPLMRARYWVVNTGLVTTTGTPAEDVFYAYNIKYDMLDAAISAPTIASPWKYSIEPLQVFAVQVANGGTFTFNDDMKIFRGDNEKLSFERLPVSLVDHINALPKPNASADARSANVEEVVEDEVLPDWFTMEAVAMNKAGDIVAMTADRTAVRFFDTATEGLDKDHDVTKTLKAANAEEDKTIFNPNNVLYTTTMAGDALLSNSVSYKVKEIPLHYLPGSEAENVVLYFDGLDGFEKINNVWLVDHFTGFEDKLYDGYEYTFSTQPNESYVGSKNRFTLVFDRDDDAPTLTESPITCYYSGSILHIGGLNEKDLGSKVFIYDLQGRLMGSTIINNYPGVEYHKSLGQGTFIVKIVGNRNFDTKFVNLQNY